MTIDVITDIPAKMPRPIGSTEIFLPGIEKADCVRSRGRGSRRVVRKLAVRQFCIEVPILVIISTTVGKKVFGGQMVLLYMNVHV